INDALGQAQIKNAVGSAEPGMESSIMDAGAPGVTQAPAAAPDYAGGTVEQTNYDTIGTEVPPVGASYDTAGAGAPPMGAGVDYGAGGGYADDYGGGYGGETDTIIEVAEQVFIEKSKKMKKQISENNEFRALAGSKIEDISNRLKRIESSMDKLQSAILEKVGEYGNGLQSIKKEMDMMQDSFKKVVGGKKK
ncbi:hypothetical protein KAR91_20925, partial [Candidatus Pacearchaeota archaeon]|nr:hypothetical protein [Candidatus Pacearchaeota archaeon]